MGATRDSYGLTAWQRRIVELIADGLTTQEIADALGVSRYSVRRTVRVLRERYEAASMEELPLAVGLE